MPTEVLLKARAGGERFGAVGAKKWDFAGVDANMVVQESFRSKKVNLKAK